MRQNYGVGPLRFGAKIADRPGRATCASGSVARICLFLAVSGVALPGSSLLADVVYETAQTFGGMSGPVDATFTLLNYTTLQITITNKVDNPVTDADGISDNT